MSHFCLLRGRLWGVFDTPLRPNTCDPSKYRCDFSTGYLCSFKKLSCFRFLRGRGVGRMQYAPTIGYVRSFEIPMQFPNWVRMALQKTVPFSSPSGPSVGRIRYAPRIGYVRSFEIPMQFSDRVRAALQKTVLFSSPSGPPAWRIQYAPTIGYVRSFEIPMRFPNRVRAILRNTDAISLSERRGCLGGGAVGATVCGGGGRE